MVNPNFPCNQGGCNRSGVSVELCNNIGDTLLNAGAAGFFEASPCPMEVFTNFVNAENNELVTRIKHNLGIVSMESVANDELD